MKIRAFAVFILITGLLATSYLCWALHRTTGSVWMTEYNAGIHWPRPWPYPDIWLYNWEKKLDAEHPVGPKFVKFNGEWWRLQYYLCGLIGLSGATSLGGFIWLIILRRRSVEAQPIAGTT
jgi:hypothetical protein